MITLQFMTLAHKVLRIITQMWNGKLIYSTITATALLYNNAIFYCTMKVLHTACPIFNLDTNICNSLLTLTNEPTRGNSHHRASTDYHSTETQSWQTAPSLQMSHHQTTHLWESGAQTLISGSCAIPRLCGRPRICPRGAWLWSQTQNDIKATVRVFWRAKHEPLADLTTQLKSERCHLWEAARNVSESVLCHCFAVEGGPAAWGRAESQ